MKTLTEVTVLMFLGGLAGYAGSQPKDLLIGKWERLDEDGNGTGRYDVYTQDGKVTWSNGSSGRDYKVVGDSTLEFAQEGRTFATYTFAVDGDELYLTSGDNRTD